MEVAFCGGNDPEPLVPPDFTGDDGEFDTGKRCETREEGDPIGGDDLLDEDRLHQCEPMCAGFPRSRTN